MICQAIFLHGQAASIYPMMAQMAEKTLTEQMCRVSCVAVLGLTLSTMGARWRATPTIPLLVATRSGFAWRWHLALLIALFSVFSDRAR